MLSGVVPPVLNSIAFLLLLLVSLSAPIIKSIYLLSAGVNIDSSLLKSGANGSVRFGVWGYCISAVQVSVLGLDEKTNSKCSKPHLGYDINQTVASALDISGFTNAVSKSLTVALVLHPVACGLAFLALLTSLGMIRRSPSAGTRLFSIITLAIGTLAGVFATIAFLIDVALVAIVRDKLNDALKKDHLQGDASLNWGNAVWMTLGATIALWAGVVGAGAGICACGRHRKQRDTY